MMTPRKRITLSVLDRALSAEDHEVVSACRRLIWADRLGWKKHHDPKDWALVKAFTE